MARLVRYGLGLGNGSKLAISQMPPNPAGRISQHFCLGGVAAESHRVQVSLCTVSISINEFEGITQLGELLHRNTALQPGYTPPAKDVVHPLFDPGSRAFDNPDPPPPWRRNMFVEQSIELVIEIMGIDRSLKTPLQNIRKGFVEFLEFLPGPGYGGRE